MTRHKGTVIYPIKKSYNLTPDQQEKLWRLSEALDMSEAEIIRLGLKLIYERTFPDGE